MNNKQILIHAQRAFDELDKIPEFNQIDSTMEADGYFREAYGSLDEFLVRLKYLIEQENELSNEVKKWKHQN